MIDMSSFFLTVASIFSLQKKKKITIEIWVRLSPDKRLSFPPTVGVVPGEPTDVIVTEATKSYVVLAWKPPVQRGHEGVMYYIEKVRRNADLPTSVVK